LLKLRKINCDPINIGGDCFHPDTLESHAAWAINEYWKAFSWQPKSCDFQGIADVLCDDCKCKVRANSTDYQRANMITFVCNQPRMDCSPIEQGGEFFKPNTTENHAGWAVNYWYQQHIWSFESCDFGNLAYLDPAVCKDGPN